MKRLVCFAGYDKDGVVDEYVLFYLKELSKFAEIIYVADCEMSKDELAKLSPYVIKAIAKRHGEYDFGSYKLAFIYAKENKLLSQYDELFLLNDSVYGPLNDGLLSIILQMEKGSSDFWGLFKHGACEGIKEHLQSWFVAMKKEVFLHKEFEKFMLEITKQKDKFTVIQKYEIGLSVLLTRLGFKMGWLLSSSDFKNLSLDTPLNHPLRLVKKHNFPFLKRGSLSYRLISFRHLKEIFSLVQYDKNLIFKHLERIEPSLLINVFSEFSLKFFVFKLRGATVEKGLKYRIIFRIFGVKILSLSFKQRYLSLKEAFERI
ncbi:rhamnan synthesis F family protein [Campylobacter troglodytis]|uniref:rhamnan synthesis F family protein n=1 Tax=Campylobacter troglodytis TaxID=654363 RepID=UPI00115975F5|nr:rhamnan synthesis F family protein [Campylobacter troglodytis]TQR56593.1 glycosyl transferase family 1 [Campylobacter troglodytis]